MPSAEQVLVATRISTWVVERTGRPVAECAVGISEPTRSGVAERAVSDSERAGDPVTMIWMADSTRTLHEVSDSERAGDLVTGSSASVSDRTRAPVTGSVASVHGRAVNLRLDSGDLLCACTTELPLSPNGVAVELDRAARFRDLGLRVGQRAWLDRGTLQVTDASLSVHLARAVRWDPRPRIGRVSPADLGQRISEARTIAIAEAPAGSLIPLLWTRDRDMPCGEPARSAAGSAAALGRAAAWGDPAGVTAGARGLAGLGPGLTPSGDDFLAGFAAAWALVPTALGHTARSGESVYRGPILSRGGRPASLGRPSIRIRGSRPDSGWPLLTGPRAGPDERVRRATHPAPCEGAPPRHGGRIREQRVSDRILDALCAGAEPGVSDLGRAWLTHAARGEVAEPLGRFFSTLSDERLGPAAVDRPALAGSVRAVLTIGATSGADWMTGALSGITSILAALPGDSLR